MSHRRRVVVIGNGDFSRQTREKLLSLLADRWHSYLNAVIGGKERGTPSGAFLFFGGGGRASGPLFDVHAPSFEDAVNYVRHTDTDGAISSSLFDLRNF